MSIQELSADSDAVFSVCCVARNIGPLIESIKNKRTQLFRETNLYDFLALAAFIREDIHLMGCVLRHLANFSAWADIRRICASYQRLCSDCLFHGSFRGIRWELGQAVGRENLSNMLQQHYDHEDLRRQMENIRGSI